MKQLTVKHLAAYLPYGVKVLPIFGGHAILDTENIGHILRAEKPLKIALRPLSQLTEVIEHNGERFVPLNWINENTAVRIEASKDSRGKFCLWCDHIQSSNYNAWPYTLIEMLNSLHFDTFSLIAAGLAEPIPSIPQP